jgi:hypothetical protein
MCLGATPVAVESIAGAASLLVKVFNTPLIGANPIMAVGFAGEAPPPEEFIVKPFAFVVLSIVTFVPANNVLNPGTCGAYNR